MRSTPVDVVKSFAKENLDLAAKFTQWLEIQSRSPHTRRVYGATVKHFCEFLGNRRVLEVKHFDVREYISMQYKRGKGPRTLAIALAALKSFFSFLQIGGLINTNACVGTTGSAPRKQEGLRTNKKG